MSVDIERIKQFINELESNLTKHPQLKQLQTKLGFPLVYALAGALGFLLILIYVFSGVRAITNLVAVVYPCYMSLKALNSDDKEDDTLWLAYWIWYGLFTVVESITDILLFWIPMYEFLKMAFYIYLYHPQVKGATVLYKKILHPWVEKCIQCENQACKAAKDLCDSMNQTSTANKTSKKME